MGAPRRAARVPRLTDSAAQHTKPPPKTLLRSCTARAPRRASSSGTGSGCTTRWGGRVRVGGAGARCTSPACPACRPDPSRSASSLSAHQQAVAAMLHEGCVAAPLATVASVEGNRKSRWAPTPLSTLEMQKRGSQVRRPAVGVVRRACEERSSCCSGQVLWPLHRCTPPHNTRSTCACRASGSCGTRRSSTSRATCEPAYVPVGRLVDLFVGLGACGSLARLLKPTACPPAACCPLPAAGPTRVPRRTSLSRATISRCEGALVLASLGAAAPNNKPAARCIERPG